VIELFDVANADYILKAIMFAPTDELYLLEADSLALVQVSQHVLIQKNLSLKEAQSQKIEDILGISSELIRECLALTSTDAVKRDVKSIGDFDLRLMRLSEKSKDYLLIIKDTATPNKTIQALIESESRFEAMVYNSPGMFFQFVLDGNGEIHFVYLSGGSKSLLGIEQETLYQDSKAFYSILNIRDHTNLNTNLKASYANKTVLDWEGRVWIDGWQDTKWINLRATPRQLPNGDTIWDGIMINITQSKKEKHEMEQSRRNLAELTAHMNTIREDERKKVAREIHDDLGGNLTAIKMGLSAALDQLKAESSQLVEPVKHLLSVVDGTFDTVHKISGNLRPNILDLGIVDALEWQAKEFQKQLGVTTLFKTNRAEIALSANQSMALFRICQEAMSNIAKYAKATEVIVDISVVGNEVMMMVCDNGIGINANDQLKVNSFGLRGMRERIAAVHGQFSISELNKNSSSAKGTVITVKIPI
jgi:two-component system, NarL family, sensor histidine kinase UhpB